MSWLITLITFVGNWSSIRIIWSLSMRLFGFSDGCGFGELELAYEAKFSVDF